MSKPPATDLSQFSLETFLPYRLNVAAARAIAGLARRYRDDFGISGAEWRVLTHLLQFGQVSVRDIEHQHYLEKSKASRAAARLEIQGYVTKTVNTADRRLVLLSQTDQGHALLAELIPLAQACQSELEQRLAGDLAGLMTALDRLADPDD
ncbi:MAG: MarR family winged helix-turn-helix transcriptional regulator [Qingshengfaniella sp.]